MALLSEWLIRVRGTLLLIDDSHSSSPWAHPAAHICQWLVGDNPCLTHCLSALLPDCLLAFLPNCSTTCLPPCLTVCLPTLLSARLTVCLSCLTACLRAVQGLPQENVIEVLESIGSGHWRQMGGQRCQTLPPSLSSPLKTLEVLFCLSLPVVSITVPPKEMPRAR